MKKVLTLLFFLALASQITCADTTSANNSCPGELISELHSISTNTAHVETGSVTNGSDDYDHYYFTPGQYGTLTLSYLSTDSTDVKISTSSCQDDGIANWNNTKSLESSTITLSNTDTVYIQIFANKTANYTITMNFTVTAPPTKNFTCANPKPFNSVFSANTTGNVLIFGNSSLCADNNNDGICEDPGTARNNNISMINNDVDGDGATTINSSAALLAMPADAQVLYAGLTWQGYLVNANQTRKDSAATIKFKRDGNSYSTTTVNTTNMNWVYFDSSRFYYQGYVDLTAYLQTNGAGKYWVGDIITDTGSGLAGGGFGGWAITVIYKSGSEVFRNLSVYSGYEGIAGGGDITAAFDYANANSCDNTNTGVGNNVSTTITGFLTPKQTPISSRLTVFAGEGDLGATGDSISVTKKDGTPVLLSNAANPVNDVMNASITRDGLHVTTGDPWYSNNSNGIDIDQYDTSLIMDTEQTSTVITLQTSGDGYFPSVYAFAAQLFEPKMCYDYAYSQNKRYFTEENNGTAAPRIVGNVVSGDPVQVRIYLRNNEDSDFNASNVTLSILDINTTQASYQNNSTSIIKANTVNPVVPVISSSSASFIKGIEHGTIPGLASSFTYFTLNTSTGTLDMPIVANITYDLLLPDGLGGFLPPITYDSDLGSDKVPMCPVSNYLYEPEWGVFNVEDTALAISDPGKYNLFTQVVNRPFSFDVVSYDPNNYTSELNTTMFVGVDLINAGGYHNIAAACSDQNSSISPPIRVNFTAGETRKTVNLNDAVAKGFLTSVNEFFAEAAESVALRVSYLVNADGSGDPIKYTDNKDGTFTMDGFTAVAGQPCAIDPRTGDPKIVQKPNGGTTQLAPVACGNAGTNGVPKEVLDQCLACLTQSNVKFVCSRDNFAIRPEGFLVKIYDNNQSVDPAKLKIGMPYTTDISAGYKYRYDVNATTHTDENPAQGYTENYVVPEVDRNITYYWRPDPLLVPLRNVSGCNDTNNSNPYLYLSNGAAVNNQNKTGNVGRYALEMRDKTWTKVDQAPIHHVTDVTFNGITYSAAAHYNLNDCDLTKSSVPQSTDIVDNTNMGCTISSSHVNQDRTTVTYSDYNITVHPYAFDISQVMFQKGIFDSNTSTNINLDANNSFVYQNNIVLASDDINMSVRFTGNLLAVGADFNQSLSNFVKNCYSEDLNLDLNTSTLPTVNAPAFQYRLRLKNQLSQIVIDDNNLGSNDDVAPRANSLVGLIKLSKDDFNKSMKGTANIELNLNFERNVSIPYNPITLTYNDFNVSCSTLANCQSRADMELAHDANGTYSRFNTAYAAAPLNIVHLYGREHVPRHRVEGPNANVPIYYEFFCDADVNALPGPCNIATFVNVPSATNSISPAELLSPDDVRWYTQLEHNTTVDGSANFTRTRDTINDAALFNVIAVNPDGTIASYQYNGVRGYPYKVTIEVPTPDWLIYNRYDGRATINNGGNVVNNFELEFTQNGNWSGRDRSGMGTDSNASAITNRRIQW